MTLKVFFTLSGNESKFLRISFRLPNSMALNLLKISFKEAELSRYSCFSRKT